MGSDERGARRNDFVYRPEKRDSRKFQGTARYVFGPIFGETRSKMKKRQKVRLVLEFELTIQTDDKKDNWEEWEWLLAIEEFDAEEARNFRYWL